MYIYCAIFLLFSLQSALYSMNFSHLSAVEITQAIKHNIDNEQPTLTLSGQERKLIAQCDQIGYGPVLSYALAKRARHHIWHLLQRFCQSARPAFLFRHLLVDERITLDEQSTYDLLVLLCIEGVGRREKYACIDLLAQQKYNLNAQDGISGVTALFKYVMYNDVPSIERLIEKGARVDVQEKITGMTPLHVVQSMSAMEVLVGHGLKVLNLLNDVGDTPLHCASRSGKIGVIEVLLKHEALPDIQNIFGDTPLHLAYQYKNFETVGKLLNAGASYKMTNKERKQALPDSFIKDLRRYGIKQEVEKCYRFTYKKT